MASEEFYKIMADLRQREKRLNDNLAALEEESRAYIRDHRELLVAIENDQGPSRPPQHPVAEALNTFHSTQYVGPPAVPSGTAGLSIEDEVSLFIPENAEDSLSTPENAGESLSIPEDAKESLFMPEDARVDEPTVNPPPRPKRRVTFSDAPATILGAMSPPENLGFGDPIKTDESFPLQSHSNDANIDHDQPVYTGSAPIEPEHGHINATQKSLPFPITSDDTNMGFGQQVYTGDKRPSKRVRHFSRTSTLMPYPAFTPISSGNGHVNTVQESSTVPVTSDDTIIGSEQPIYTGDRRPSKRARHSSRTSTLMLNTGFTPTLPDSKPATNPQDFIGTHNPQDFIGPYNPQNLTGTYNPQDFVNTYDPPLSVDGLMEPWQSEEYANIAAESKLPDHVNSHFVCPYPDCGKLYVNSGDVEKHLEHDHPDWALIKDAAIASDSI
ncbi:hypothetical protein KCU95_g8314, partial [Aureobasidium melanogenum]